MLWTKDYYFPITKILFLDPDRTLWVITDPDPDPTGQVITDQDPGRIMIGKFWVIMLYLSMPFSSKRPDLQ